MAIRTCRSIVLYVLLGAAVTDARTNAAVQGAQAAPTPPRSDNAESVRHVEAARTLAGSDQWLLGPFQFFCVPGGARPNNVNAPPLEPVRLFDNLYALGNSETTVYAITTSEGIILIDSGYAGQAESILVPGLEALGLDPATVKFVLLGHGHGDHFGGSQYFQERFGARVGTTAADWDVIHPATPPANPAAANQTRPKRDLVLAEGQPVTLGDTTINVVAIPGHTPGALAFTFQVRDGASRHMAGLFGGTILTADRITTPGLTQYVQSIAHYLDMAKAVKVDVEIQNHPIFDGMSARLTQLRSRKPGTEHPFVVGSDRYQKFWSIVSECMQAEIARR